MKTEKLRHRHTRDLTFPRKLFWKSISGNIFQKNISGSIPRIKDQGPCLGTNEHPRRAVDMTLRQIEALIELYISI